MTGTKKNAYKEHLQYNKKERNVNNMFFDLHKLLGQCQNFMDPRHPHHSRQNLTHTTLEPMHPRYPRHLHYLAGSNESNEASSDFISKIGISSILELCISNEIFI